jgi:ornithine cyclodeaminase/alanine dehydrogenase-like protein (mu-crystallin family)
MALWLSESDVHSSLPMSDLIPAMEGALCGFSGGNVVQPVRTAIEYRPAAYFGLMPAYDPASDLLGAKLLTFIPANLEQGLPTHQALIVLFHPGTGELLAVADGRYITEARTAAVSAVSARYLARPDARVLAILGSGVQAQSHLAALPLARDFEEIRVWSPNRARLDAFVAKAGGPVRAAESAEHAVREADVVVLATNCTTPVIEDTWIAPGTHIIAVGACRPNHREMPGALMERALLVVDSRAAAVIESGDVILSGSQNRIHAELGEVAAGAKSGRTNADQITIFKSLGLAIEDVASAGLAYRRVLASGRAKEVTL